MPDIIDKSVFDYGGKTLVSLATDNNTLCVANKKGLAKILQLNKPEEEPEVLEIAKNLTSIRCDTDNTCVLTTLEGDAYRYNLSTLKDRLLARSALPLRDCTALHSGKMCVFGGDDLEMLMVELSDDNCTKHSVKVDEQISQLSYSPQTNLLSVSFINGNVQFFSLSSTRPNRVHELTGYIPVNSYDDTHRDKLLTRVTDEFDKDTPPDTLEDEDEEDEKINDPEFCDENRICTRPAWHPTGLLFALPCDDSTVKTFSIKGYELSKTLKSPFPTKCHYIDLKYDPLHGTFVAAIDLQNRLVIWNWQSSEVAFKKELKQKVTNFLWRVQPDAKTMDLIIGTWSGEIVLIQSAIEDVKSSHSKDRVEVDSAGKTSLFVESDLDESDSESVSAGNGGQNGTNFNQDDGGDLFNEDEIAKRKYHFDDEEDFIDDDDGAGYVSQKRKRSEHGLSSSKVYRNSSHTSNTSNPVVSFRYKPISPGATPFGSNDRRYLTMNNVGYVCLVNNSQQNSITVSFFDIGRFKEYHFEDVFGYDVCCLNENGALFAQSKSGQIHYRSHTMLNSNWTKIVPLQWGERITSVATTPKRMMVGTSFGYMRIYNQYGIPLFVEKMSPVVAIAAQDFKIFSVHYSPQSGASYSLFEQSPTSSKYYQRECPLPIALPQQGVYLKGNLDGDFLTFNPLGIKSLFFSVYGDPCIFGSDNVLLVLSKWRAAMESRWLPILDTNMEIWKMSGGIEKSQVHVWPLGLTYDTLNCILVKGKYTWPEFPLPLPSEMEVRIPIYVKSSIIQDNQRRKNEEKNALVGEGNEEDDAGDKESTEIIIPQQMAAEEEFLRAKVLSSLLSDSLDNDGELYGNESEILASLNGAYDKSLLRLFAAACSDQNSDMALSLAQELKQDRALAAAVKISERAELLNLAKRVNELREARYDQKLNSV